MRKTIVALALSGVMASATNAQVVATADGYRVCAPAATQQGITAATEACGTLKTPDFASLVISSESELKAHEATRETFRNDVAAYGQCITQLINSYRRPGAPADSKIPDQAACAHSWAQDQATQAVRDYGKACIDYSNRSMMDAALPAYDGACYPTAKENAHG